MRAEKLAAGSPKSARELWNSGFGSTSNTGRGTDIVEAAARLTERDDQALVRCLQAGDMSAFAELVLRYQDRVYNAVWRICGHAEDARDLTQDAFIKAYESIGSFQGASSFYTWLFRIAVNLALSHGRTMKRRKTQSLDVPTRPSVAGSQAATLAARMQENIASDPAQPAMVNEMHGHVIAALGMLEDDFRAVIVLRDIEDFDYARIGEVLGIATGTVKSRLHRGRLALRKLLEPVLPQGSG